jgi:hypothetical protein
MEFAKYEYDCESNTHLTNFKDKLEKNVKEKLENNKDLLLDDKIEIVIVKDYNNNDIVKKQIIGYSDSIRRQAFLG